MDRCCIGEESPTIGEQAGGSFNTTANLKNAIDKVKKNKDATTKRFLANIFESKIPPFRPAHFPCTARHL